MIHARSSIGRSAPDLPVPCPQCRHTEARLAQAKAHFLAQQATIAALRDEVLTLRCSIDNARASAEWWRERYHWAMVANEREDEDETVDDVADDETGGAA